MRICLVPAVTLAHWFEPNGRLARASLPLGVLSLAASIREMPHEITIVDLNQEINAGHLQLTDDFYQTAANLILAESPEVIGMSTMCNSYHITLRLAMSLKALLPSCYIILGGPQASYTDIETLDAFPFIDIIVREEADRSFPELIDKLAAGSSFVRVHGLTIRGSRGIVRTPDASLISNLDDLPLPAYDLYPYELPSALPIDVGRGCPFNCTFCATSKFWHRRFRLKSVDRLLYEIRILKDNYNAVHLNFEHDNFTFDRRRLLSFCNRLSRSGIDVVWGCSARIDSIDDELLRNMAGCGCKAVFYGIESGSQEMQRVIRKNLHLRDVGETIEATIAAGIQPTTSFIVGFPEESEYDVKGTFNMIQGLLGYKRLSLQLHLLGPLPGTLEYTKHICKWRYDGYHSSVAANGVKLLDSEWISCYPHLFSACGYFETPCAPRSALKDMELFVFGPCSILRETVLLLLKEMRCDLWDLHNRWNNSPDTQALIGRLAEEQLEEEYLFQFCDFAVAQLLKHIPDAKTRVTDELLRFYFEHYGHTPVKLGTVGDQ